MNIKETITQQQAEEILHVLDDSIQKGPWEASNFLTAVGKNLQAIRANFAALTEEAYGQSKNEDHMSNQIAFRSDMQEIFISLYSVDSSLTAWERILSNLPKQNVSRPIYVNEEDAQLLIKSKIKKMNEAYVAIFIHKDDIITMDSTRVIVDKLGKPLLSIKDNAIAVKNYHYFLHDGVSYQFIDGKLVKKP